MAPRFRSPAAPALPPAHAQSHLSPSPATGGSGGDLPVQLCSLYVAQPMGFAAGEEEEVSLRERHTRS